MSQNKLQQLIEDGTFEKMFSSENMDACGDLAGDALIEKLSEITGLDRDVVKEAVIHKATEMIVKRMTMMTPSDREDHVTGKRVPDVTTSAIVARAGDLELLKLFYERRFDVFDATAFMYGISGEQIHVAQWMIENNLIGEKREYMQKDIQKIQQTMQKHDRLDLYDSFLKLYGTLVQ